MLNKWRHVDDSCTEQLRLVPESLKRQSDAVCNMIPRTYRSQISKVRIGFPRCTRISFRIARPRISIALSGNTLARGVANGKRESGSISRKPNSWDPGFATIASGDGGAFSLLVERTCPVSPRPSLPTVFSPVSATILSAPLQAQVCRGRPETHAG